MLATERDWAYLSVEQERLDGRPVSLWVAVTRAFRPGRYYDLRMFSF
jgi:hypothetical protein